MTKTIKNIPEFDRPREKIVKKGIQSLNNEELLMVILGRGMKGRDVRMLAKEILKQVEKEPKNINLEKLTSIQGIGLAKAGQILASFEFAKRYLIKEGITIKNLHDIIDQVKDIRNKKQEHFITLTINGAATLIEKRTIFIGTVNNSIVHPREIFANAISDRATGIIFAHNHPMDDPKPSKEDIAITIRLCEVAKLVGIEVIDHIIVSKTDYFSFQAEGILNKKLI